MILLTMFGLFLVAMFVYGIIETIWTIKQEDKFWKDYYEKQSKEEKFWKDYAKQQKLERKQQKYGHN